MKREEELKAVQTTVETKMKSYASKVSKNCPAPLTTKKIEAAVRKVVDKDDRSKNVIIYGIVESQNENLQGKVEEVLENTGEKPLLRDCVRVGVKKADATLPRPVKFTLNSIEKF